MMIKLKTQYHIPKFYQVLPEDEIVKTAIDYKTIEEAIEEFNRVVEITESLMRTKTIYEYQPYDKIWIQVGNSTIKRWRKEDAE